MTEEILDLSPPYQSRHYQRPFLDAMRGGCKNALLCWHRQSGKDMTLLYWLLESAMKRVGNYWYVFPDYPTVRRAFWEKKDNQGLPNIGHYIPEGLIYHKHDTNKTITLINPNDPTKPGSIIEVLAGDSIDPNALRGATLAGVIFSEFAYFDDDSIIDALTPSVQSKENDGWMVYVSTPNGHNHFYEMWETNQTNPDWFTELLTIEDTGVYDLEFIDTQLRAGRPWEKLQQEYFCSFTALRQGAPFSEAFKYLYLQKRITNVPWDPSKLVHTSWDVGRDGTVIWCFQLDKQIGAVKYIDCIEGKQLNLEHYIFEMKKKPYYWGTHLGPHDLNDEQFFAGNTKADTASKLGVEFTVMPKPKPGMKHTHIEAGNKLLYMSYLDKDNCEKGIKGLREYHYKWDAKTKTLSKEPVHDWSSHFADAFVTGALGWEEIEEHLPGQNPYEDEDLECDYKFDPLDCLKGIR